MFVQLKQGVKLIRNVSRGWAIRVGTSLVVKCEKNLNLSSSLSCGLWLVRLKPFLIEEFDVSDRFVSLGFLHMFIES